MILELPVYRHYTTYKQKSALKLTTANVICYGFKAELMAPEKASQMTSLERKEAERDRYQVAKDTSQASGASESSTIQRPSTVLWRLGAWTQISAP